MYEAACQLMVKTLERFRGLSGAVHRSLRLSGVENLWIKLPRWGLELQLPTDRWGRVSRVAWVGLAGNLRRCWRRASN